MISIVLLALVAANAVLAVLPDEKTCGVPTVEPDMRIVGGKEAKQHSWPWQVQLWFLGKHMCGASLLSPDTVLTAAHCIHNMPMSLVKVRVGRHYVSGNDPYTQTANIKTWYIHESYNARNQANDIAIIKLSSSVQLNKYVSTVCMPSRSTNLPTGTMVYVTGWGHLKENGEDSMTLQQVAVPIVERSTCNQRSYYNGQILQGMICAGFAAGGKDACQNDSGGPLVAKVGSRWEQYGVVSWGKGCAVAYKPGVYADVVYYNSWIRSKFSQIEREELEVAGKFRPIPFGAAFRN